MVVSLTDVGDRQTFDRSILQVSIVTPIYNEVESLPHLLVELVPALEGMDQSFEIICVDDGSSDGSFAELKKLRAQDERVRIIQFRRDFGQTAAFAADDVKNWMPVCRVTVPISMNAGRHHCRKR